jgi:hypothetical protein
MTVKDQNELQAMRKDPLKHTVGWVHLRSSTRMKEPIASIESEQQDGIEVRKQIRKGFNLLPNYCVFSIWIKSNTQIFRKKKGAIPRAGFGCGCLALSGY